jgi:hypothetical protein
LRAVVDAHYFYCLILNPVNNDVGKTGENQFASAFDPSLATSAWKASQAAAAIIEGLSDIRRSFRIVSLNVSDYVVEVVSGGSGPSHAH